MNWKATLAATAMISAMACASAASAGVVLFDNFSQDTLLIGENWAGDGILNSLPFPTTTGLPSTDLVGPGFYGQLCPGGVGNCVDLDGSTSTSPSFTPAGILQSGASFAAGTYTLTFDLAGNERGAPAETTLVTLGDTTIASLTLDSSSPFTVYTYTFTTSGGNLTFTEDSPADNQGNVLASVQLVSVPEPASWALMLAGFAGLGGALRYRRKTLAAA